MGRGLIPGGGAGQFSVKFRVFPWLILGAVGVSGFKIKLCSSLYS